MNPLDQEVVLVYDNYKEPLKPFEGGYGYAGTIAQSEDKTKIQCHFCGGLFESLTGHIGAKHGLSGREYKEKVQLTLSTALVADVVREKQVLGRRTSSSGGPGKNFDKGLAQYWEEVRAGKRPGPRKGDHKWSLEYRNKKGLCQDQVLEKIRDLAKELGKTPSHDQFREKYTRFNHSIYYFFGSWNTAVKMAGYVPIQEQQRQKWEPEKLKEYLRLFYKEHGRSPQKSDWNRGLLPNHYHYYKHWPTLNEARLAAGIPAVIPISGGYYYELSPEKFEQYEQAKDEVPNRYRRNGTLGILRKLAGRPRMVFAEKIEGESK